MDSASLTHERSSSASAYGLATSGAWSCMSGRPQSRRVANLRSSIGWYCHHVTTSRQSPFWLLFCSWADRGPSLAKRLCSTSSLSPARWARSSSSPALLLHPPRPRRLAPPRRMTKRLRRGRPRQQRRALRVCRPENQGAPRQVPRQQSPRRPRSQSHPTGITSRPLLLLSRRRFRP